MRKTIKRLLLLKRLGGADTAGILVSNLGDSVPAATVAPDICTDDNSERTYVTASWTPPTVAGSLILLFVASQYVDNIATIPTPTVTGNNLTWTEVDSSVGGSGSKLSLFAAINTEATAGETTIDYGAGLAANLDYCRASFCYLTGVDLSGGVAGAVVQTKTMQGPSATSLAIPLDAAPTPPNRVVSAVRVESGVLPATIVPQGTGWTVVERISTGQTYSGLVVAYGPARNTSTTAGFSWTGSKQSHGLAVELKVDLGGA